MISHPAAPTKSSEQTQFKGTSPLTFKVKWGLGSIVLTDPLSLEYWAHKIDKINSDPSKNEKIGIHFKGVTRTQPFNQIIHSNLRLNYDSLPRPITGERFLLEVKNYAIFLKENHSPFVFPEAVYFYYPLDITNSNPEVSEEDKLIETVTIYGPNIPVQIVSENPAAIFEKRTLHASNQLINMITYEKEKLSNSLNPTYQSPTLNAPLKV